MLSTVFYHSVLPLCTCWTIISLIVIYWQDKYFLLRHSKYPRAIGPELPFEMIELLEWIVIVYGASTFVFANILNNETSGIGLICIAYGIINVCLPMRKINKMIFW